MAAEVEKRAAYRAARNAAKKAATVEFRRVQAALNEELKAMISIITTMSYSKVKVNGYPDLAEYQTAYHIVREADLLAAYDIDRCIMFGMFNDGVEYSDALVRAKDIFTTRVLTYRSDNLFVTDRSKQLSEALHRRACDRMKTL